MFNRIMIHLALLEMSLAVLLSSVSSITAEFNATNKSENVSLVTTSVDTDKSLPNSKESDKSLPNSKESDNKSTKKNSNSIIDSFISFFCILSLFSFLLVFLHNFIIDCLISYEIKKREKQI